MKINERILEILAEENISQQDAICYLISLYFGYTPTYIPDNLKQKLNTTKIYEADRLSRAGDVKSYKWNIALFEHQETKFDWVKTEYMQLFKDANKDKTCSGPEAISRMKKLFAKNPEVRKDDVINCTKMYIRNTDSKYLMLPHYFIAKGSGADKTETILFWLEKYEIAKDQEEGRDSITNTMQ